MARGGPAHSLARVDDGLGGPRRRRVFLDVVAATRTIGVIGDRLIGQDRKLVVQARELARQVLVFLAIHGHTVNARLPARHICTVDPHVFTGVIHHRSCHVLADAIRPHHVSIGIENVRRRSTAILGVLPGDQKSTKKRRLVAGRDRDLRQAAGQRRGGDGVVGAFALAIAAGGNAVVVGLGLLHAEQQGGVFAGGRAIDGRRHAIARIKAKIDVRRLQTGKGGRPLDNTDRPYLRADG